MLETKQKGEDVSGFADNLARASLKHWQVLEDLRRTSPEDAQPLVNQINDYARVVYEKTSQLLNECGRTPPVNPFGS